ncbi:hypothetical protein TNIN_218511 [Trichonephila inaurata madagascariensis]|uniref:Uncharacterized protein n=1 Tax=Trichonephila inaurata madagascariensis TaxID=2747483 RepID=A0A8X7CUC6_9ARAC|nr:hypothetical protein TNIN_218511 [Trichonephila inaurata madagascariensis]
MIPIRQMDPSQTRIKNRPTGRESKEGATSRGGLVAVGTTRDHAGTSPYPIRSRAGSRKTRRKERQKGRSFAAGHIFFAAGNWGFRFQKKDSSSWTIWSSESAREPSVWIWKEVTHPGILGCSFLFLLTSSQTIFIESQVRIDE